IQRMTSNQSDMKTMSEVMPRAAAATMNDRLTRLPATVHKPACTPWAATLAVISDIIGPGVNASSKQAPANAANTCSDITCSPACHKKRYSSGLQRAEPFRYDANDLGIEPAKPVIVVR